MHCCLFQYTPEASYTGCPDCICIVACSSTHQRLVTLVVLIVYALLLVPVHTRGLVTLVVLIVYALLLVPVHTGGLVTLVVLIVYALLLVPVHTRG